MTGTTPCRSTANTPARNRNSPGSLEHLMVLGSPERPCKFSTAPMRDAQPGRHPNAGIIFSLERANSDPWSGSLENCSWVTCHQNTANGCATEKDELAALKHAKVTVGPRLCRGARGPSNREVTLGILFAPVQMEMRVRLTRKLADEIDGIDLKGQTVGDVFELPEREARVLLAEEWAIPDSRAAERPRQVPYPQSRAS